MSSVSFWSPSCQQLAAACTRGALGVQATASSVCCIQMPRPCARRVMVHALLERDAAIHIVTRQEDTKTGRHARTHARRPRAPAAARRAAPLYSIFFQRFCVFSPRAGALSRRLSPRDDVSRALLALSRPINAKASSVSPLPPRHTRPVMKRSACAALVGGRHVHPRSSLASMLHTVASL